MVAPIVKEILRDRQPQTQREKAFHTDVFTYRTELFALLGQYKSADKALAHMRCAGEFEGYGYDMRYMGRDVRVFCGGNSKQDILLDVIVLDAEQPGRNSEAYESKGYILRKDNTIMIQRNNIDILLVDGTIDKHRQILNKVESLVEEARIKLNKKFLPASRSGQASS